MMQFVPQTNLYFSAGVVGFLVASIFAYPIYRLLLALKSRQTVSQYAPEGHQKKQGTPTMGGLIIVVGALAGLGYAIQAMPTKIPNYDVSALLGCAILLGGFALIGFTDDFVVPRLIKGKRGLGWKQKILMQLALAGIAVWMDHRQFDFEWFAGVFLVLFFSNAYNFADGLDWLAGTILLALGAGVIAVAWNASMFDAAVVVAPILGAAIPFLMLNRPPAKLFMGDVGSLPIGAVLGYLVAGIAMTHTTPHLYTWGYGEHMGSFLFNPPYDGTPEFGFFVALFLLSFMMVAELVPVPLQIASVKLRKKKIFPYTPIHHAFEKAGWKESKVVLAFFACQVVLTLAAWGTAYWTVTAQDQARRQAAIDHLGGMR